MAVVLGNRFRMLWVDSVIFFTLDNSVEQNKKAVTQARAWWPDFGRAVLVSFVLLTAVGFGLPRGARAAVPFIYKQTDITGVANDFSCDGTTENVPTQRFDLAMQQVGTAGTASNFVRVDAQHAQIGVTYISPINDPGLKNWQSGNWVVRLDDTVVDGSITWDGTCIFVVDSAGTTNKATVGSQTGQAIPLDTLGVKTMTISGSAQSVLTTDRVFIELVFYNSAPVNQHNFNFVADQTNDTPLAPPPGMQVSFRSDKLSDSRPSVTSNHAIAFTTNDSLDDTGGSSSDTVVLTFPADFSLANITCADIDVATGTQFLLNVAGNETRTNCPNTPTSWGMLIDSTGPTITLTTPSSVKTFVATGTPITISIGSSATSQNQGVHWITNPSAAGIYTISVGGTFGGSGNMLVSINSGISVQVSIPESLAFTVSSVAAVNCTADDGASVTAIGTSPTSVSLGTFPVNTFSIGCQDLVVSTNAGAGYSLTTQETSAMSTVDGKYTIPDTTCDAGSCSESAAAAWTDATKNGFGHTCFNQDNNNNCNAAYSNGTKFRQFANIAGGETPQAIMSSSTPASVTARIKFRLSVGASQAAGTYKTQILYIINGTF